MTEDPFDVPPPGAQRELHDEDEFHTGKWVDVKHIPAEETKYGNPQFEFHFLVDGEEQPVRYYTQAYISNDDRNKLRKLVKGMGGDPDQRVNVKEQIVGKKAKVMFEHYDSDGVKKERIDRVKAVD